MRFYPAVYCVHSSLLATWMRFNHTTDTLSRCGLGNPESNSETETELRNGSWQLHLQYVEDSNMDSNWCEWITRWASNNDSNTELVFLQVNTYFFHIIWKSNDRCCWSIQFLINLWLFTKIYNWPMKSVKWERNYSYSFSLSSTLWT